MFDFLSHKMGLLTGIPTDKDSYEAGLASLSRQQFACRLHAIPNPWAQQKTTHVPDLKHKIVK